ncbi:gamma-glutamyltransferase [Streptomyces sp. NBC_00233]|uniref:gamma-glutamyltransferase n=1 Tax=Streptomyces sp. NBC_00233 TaxID=2975686 RepID=UPI00225BEE3A|nr:gamma-glutamyltransferase [Streptomyces sp. NBC_00233]MCX5230897.1 gamma-glutamyltransferase [Streptomyces sp. NBC_00233]
MIPAHIPDEPPLTYADSFDIPVLFRNGPADKPKRQWRTAEHKVWAGSDGFPVADGWYAPTTTWREIIKAATEVGRDVTPHLQNQPRYAHGELVARVAPLYAYLGAHPVEPRYPVPGAKGRRLTLNPVYAHGTERTAKNAAAYRLGMTMTEWACRSLLGLGQTEHLELGGPIPALRNTFKDPKRKLPDLWGRHETEEMYWLMEAKGGACGVDTLRKGWTQLEAGSKVLGSYAHRTVLVGASVRPGDDLFLTIDHNLHPGQLPLPPAGSDPDDATVGPGNLEDHLGDSDDALIGAARTQMLAYLALRSAPASQLRTVPVPANRASRHRRSGLTTPLEDDALTLALRADARGAAPRIEQHTLRAGIRTMGLDDFLTCRIPGTEIHLGMSRKLFAVCARLHEEDLAIARRTPGLRAEDQPAVDQGLSEDAQEVQRLTQRRIFREQQEEARPRLRPLLREAYERGATSDWRDLLRRPQEPELDLAGDEGLLEAATPETYLAVSRYDLPPVHA